jgi:hypothetical protein
MLVPILSSSQFFGAQWLPLGLLASLIMDANISNKMGDRSSKKKKKKTKILLKLQTGLKYINWLV